MDNKKGFEQIEKLLNEFIIKNDFNSYRALLNDRFDIEKINYIGKKVKALASNGDKYKNVRCAVLSNFTCNAIENYLRAFLFSHKVNLDLYLGGFNQIFTEIYNLESKLYTCNPEILIILVDEFLVLEQLPDLWTVATDLKKAVDNISASIEHAINYFSAKSDALIIVNTISVSEKTLNQIIDYRSKSLVHLYINQLNHEILKISVNNKQVITLDTNVLLQNSKVYSLRDERLSLYAAIRFHDSLLFKFSYEISKIIQAKLGLSKKCLVLDLDNTLWGGVIGDDDVEGIRLGGGYEGEAYIHFQKAIKLLKKQGVLLAINSKNEVENVVEVFNKHPDMHLSLDDFVAIKVNWLPKHENMKSIINTLNIGPDQFVFVDDNRAECEIVAKNIPEIHAINLSNDPAFYVDELLEAGLFDKLEITEEDQLRSNDYIAENKRKNYFLENNSIEDYLTNLGISLRIFIPNIIEIDRISQLTLRTNQFNLTNCRFTSNQIKSKLENKWLIVGSESEDKFGKNGIIGAVMAEIIDNEIYIRNFLLSCRVFSRGIEKAILSKLLSHAKERNFSAVIGEYIPTKKNSIVKDFYSTNGFVEDSFTLSHKKFIHNLIDINASPDWITITDCDLEYAYGKN
jgi:FkbH-like protein